MHESCSTTIMSHSKFEFQTEQDVREYKNDEKYILILSFFVGFMHEGRMA